MADLGISFSDIAKDFREESLELLDSMESSLILIRENGIDNESINAVFRAAHTIKGVAGMYKLEYIVEFTHVAENLLDKVRNGQIQLTDDLCSLLLECKDHMNNLVEYSFATLNNVPLSDTLQATTVKLCKLLTQNEAGRNDLPQTSTQVVVEATNEEQIWNLDLKFKPQVLEHGFDPSGFIAYLKNMSSDFLVITDTSKVPLLHDLDPTLCYLDFHIKFKTDASETDILEVFDFVQDDCEIILKEYIAEAQPVQIKQDQITPVTLDGVLVPQSAATIQQNLQQTSYSIRVDAEKIDKLINLIGEMVIANANVMQKSLDVKNQELVESVSIVSRMLEDVRESAMQIRMVQIGETFNRFKRIVMDLSKKLDKDVELIIKGGDTELDKTVVEKINDPLVHIVRNAIDHGLEIPSERIANGKNPKGSITLNAYHDAGTVVIEISDNGKGLNEELIRAKAIEKGLIEDGANLTQKQIFELILQPGFSTADTVTDLSGRGVGMDVVKRNIEALRGNIEIQSKTNKGTSFIIRLPLTLAIIDGFLVKVGDTFYVIPLEMVVECLELSEAYRHDMHGNNYINLRGSVLPLLNVTSYFNENKSSFERENIVVAQYAGRRFGFIVDELYGEFQTVIKPLGKIFKNIKGISGATILGSGSVALILDIPILVGHILSQKREDVT
ncbi:MAG: hypothetical protein RL154_1541 [Pseudomonadota bacterium]|jgi:two-component system chemotaxis sensor kinase CheA